MMYIQELRKERKGFGPSATLFITFILNKFHHRSVSFLSLYSKSICSFMRMFSP